MAANKRFLGREDLLSGKTHHFRCHEIELGDGVLRIRELTAEEWLLLGKEEKQVAKQSEENADNFDSLTVHFDRVAKLVCKTAVDEKGDRIFKEGDEEKIRQSLGAESLMTIYKRLAQVAPPTEGIVGGSTAQTVN